ncbi:MAG: [ribosomal protein S18]-alanine N-acetyltransferase [Clostridia bacterium]|jgi:ribosomal-protein-alanine N-acetyltransferase|nr:[ribosomal protein S18]-alanine N-acetyltransferase [Clostridia bacterium]MDN5322788.1 [ribosomal protein S18]-alanine N-acetyltransferase [Clostridia bacterium]
MSEISSKVLLRKMELGDVPQVVEIEKLSFPTPWSPYAFSCEILDNNFAYYLVVIPKDDQDKIIGYGGMWVILDEAHITNIAIAPEHRGKRLGEILLQNLMEMALKKGAERITLEVRVSNTSARKLYERLGFKAAGLRKGYYVDANEDAVIMWKDLREKASG